MYVVTSHMKENISLKWDTFQIMHNVKNTNNAEHIECQLTI
jgi:hypothetical protein